jgi:hypothetical protein
MQAQHNAAKNYANFSSRDKKPAEEHCRNMRLEHVWGSDAIGRSLRHVKICRWLVVGKTPDTYGLGVNTHPIEDQAPSRARWQSYLDCYKEVCEKSLALHLKPTTSSRSQIKCYGTVAGCTQHTRSQRLSRLS